MTGIVAISGLLTIIFFPEPLFANKLEHGQFKVYSNNKIDKDIELVLDNSINLIKRSELYDPTNSYDIFLGYNSFFNEIDNTFLGNGPTARATDNNILIKAHIDSKRNLVFPTFYQNCEANLSYIIAHEMIHCLQEIRYGKLKFNPFRHPEYWKLEGYPEYISRQIKLLGKDYDLIKEIERYIDLESSSTDGWIAIEEGGCKAPKYYYKSRLMMEYLIDIKRFSYDKVLADTISEDRIYTEMMNWKDEVQVKRHVISN